MSTYRFDDTRQTIHKLNSDRDAYEYVGTYRQFDVHQKNLKESTRIDRIDEKLALEDAGLERFDDFNVNGYDYDDYMFYDPSEAKQR